MKKNTYANRCRRGNAMVEFAVAMMLIVPIFAATFQYGYSYYVYNSLETSLRAAARYAGTRTYDSPNTTPSAAYQTAVSNMAVYGDPSGGTRALAPGLTPANVNIRMTFQSARPFEVTVELRGYRLAGIFGEFTLNGKPSVAFPYLGYWDPV